MPYLLWSPVGGTGLAEPDYIYCLMVVVLCAIDNGSGQSSSDSAGAGDGVTVGSGGEDDPGGISMQRRSKDLDRRRSWTAKFFGKSDSDDSSDDETYGCGAKLKFENGTWRSLWNYVCEVNSDFITQEDVMDGHTAAGITIDAFRARLMVERLTVHLDSGAALTFVDMAKSKGKSDCPFCDARGNRPRSSSTFDDDMWMATSPGNRICRACDGIGQISLANEFEVSDLERFVAFAHVSRGFCIQ